MALTRGERNETKGVGCADERAGQIDTVAAAGGYRGTCCKRVPNGVDRNDRKHRRRKGDLSALLLQGDREEWDDHGLQRHKCRVCGKRVNALTGTPPARLRMKGPIQRRCDQVPRQLPGLVPRYRPVSRRAAEPRVVAGNGGWRVSASSVNVTRAL